MKFNCNRSQYRAQAAIVCQKVHSFGGYGRIREHKLSVKGLPNININKSVFFEVTNGG